MATFHFLTEDNLAKIAPSLPPWVGNYEAAQTCAIAETLEVCNISASDLEDKAKTAQDCLGSQSDYWHLQVRVNNTPDCCIRLSRSENGDWEVGARYDKEMAQQIDTALTWVDRYIHDRFTVRMFEIPSYYITGLTLEDGDDISVYIVMKVQGMPVETNKIYSFEEIRTILMQTAPIRGVELQDLA